MVLMVGGRAGGRGQRQKHLLLKQTTFFVLLVASNVFLFFSHLLGNGGYDKGSLRKQINALLMWEDGKRLFVRGVISRCSAFDAHGFNHPLNLSITPPLCSPLLGLCTPHKANFWLCSTGNPFFKRQWGTVFIGFQNLAGDKVNYPVVSSPTWESECEIQLAWLRERKANHDCRLMAGMCKCLQAPWNIYLLTSLNIPTD